MSSFGVENSTTEFKSELNDKLEKVIVGFLNSEKGGDIYIGVDDSGRVIGVENDDALMLAVSDRVKNNIQPSCLGLYDVYPEERDGKTVVHVVISRGTEKPYYLKRFGQSPAGCYIRVGSGVQQMTVAMIDQLYASRLRNSLRNIPAPASRELSFQQLKIYYQEKGLRINDSFLSSLDLYTPNGQMNYAAYLLADENSISIKVAKYAGIDKCDLIENEEYGFCSLVKATHRVLDKLNIENRTLTHITGAAEREQRRLVEARALREALINAMVHNDYSSEVSPVIEIYADRICITSYGGLVSGLSWAECLAGRSMPRNRELMRVFRDLDLVEHLGSGMHRILAAYDASIFNVSEHFFEIRFPISSSRPESGGVTAQVTPQDKGLSDSTLQNIARLLGAATAQVTAQVAAQVAVCCKEQPQSAKTIMSALGMKHWKTFQTNYLFPLIDAGLIEHTIPGKPTSRLQKYRLTAAGMACLDAGKGGRR